MRPGDIISEPSFHQLLGKFPAVLNRHGQSSQDGTSDSTGQALNARTLLLVLTCLHLFQESARREFDFDQLTKFLADLDVQKLEMICIGNDQERGVIRERLLLQPEVIDKLRKRMSSISEFSFFQAYISKVVNRLLQEAWSEHLADNLVPKVGKAKISGKKNANRFRYKLRWQMPRGTVTPHREKHSMKIPATSIAVPPKIDHNFAQIAGISRAKVFNVPSLPPQGIHGREDDLKDLASRLLPNTSQSSGNERVAVLGLAGMGKTTLAIQFGHHFENEFPDGVLWTALGPNPSVRRLLSEWGRLLNIDLAIEADEADCSNRLRDALHGKRILLLIDDIWDSQQGKHFCLADPTWGRTIFTTREPHIGNTLATREATITLKGISPPAALTILVRLVGSEIEDRREKVLSLCERLEYLPLALTLAGRLLANEADVSSDRMDRILGELSDRTTGRQARLDLRQEEGRFPNDGPMSLRAILAMSVERLAKDDQVHFALLSKLGAEPLRWDVTEAAAIWDLWPGLDYDTPDARLAIQSAEDIIARLVARGLVERDSDSYHMHALLADFASEMSEKL